MKRDESQIEMFRQFEGTWLCSPSGNKAFARVVNGELLIPYSRSGDNKLAGHYYNCCIFDNKLVCRFECFEPYVSGILVLRLGPNHTLMGGWWPNDKIPKSVQDDISRISENLPEIVGCTWVLMPKAKIPKWAREYFSKDFPAK